VRGEYILQTAGTTVKTEIMYMWITTRNWILDVRTKN